MSIERTTVRSVLIIGLSCSLLLAGPVGVSAHEYAPVARDSTVPGSETTLAQTANDSNETVDEFREDWPEQCEDAPLLDATGVYGGLILSPKDVDTFKIEMGQKGTYVTVAPVISPADGTGVVEARDLNVTTSALNVSAPDADFDEPIEPGESRYALRSRGDGMNESSFQIWADSDNPVICFVVSERRPDDANLPYEWQVRLNENEPEPQPVTGSQLSPSEDEEIRELRNRTEALERRIDALEERVAQLEQAENETG